MCKVTLCICTEVLLAQVYTYFVITVWLGVIVVLLFLAVRGNYNIIIVICW